MHPQFFSCFVITEGRRSEFVKPQISTLNNSTLITFLLQYLETPTLIKPRQLDSVLTSKFISSVHPLTYKPYILEP